MESSSGVEPPRSGPPRVPATALRRPALLARLDGPWDIALLHGPAGSGKSVLLAQWSATRSMPAWFDAAEVAGAFSDPSERVARLAHWLGALGEEVVVIDSAEQLDDGLAADLGRALDRLPALRLVVATRSGRVATALARASEGASLLLAAEDLRVTEDELAAAAPELAAARRIRLLEDADALVVAVRDALEGSRGQTLERFRRALVERAGERPPGYREGLARLGLFRELRAEIAESVGISPEWLRCAEEDGLGRIEDGWLRLTRFAVEALAPLAAELDPAERERLVRAALDGGIRAERPVEALRLAAGLRDFDLATEIIGQHGMFFASAARAAAEVFAGIPASQLGTHPVLILFIAQAANLDPATRMRGLQLFGHAILALQTQAHLMRPVEAAVARTFAATLMRITPLADRALRQTLKEYAKFMELAPEEREPLGATEGFLIAHVGLTAMASGDFGSALDAFERAYSLMRELGRNEMTDPLAMMCAALALSGDLPRAGELAAFAEGLEWPEGWRGGLQGQTLELALAILDVEAGDPDGALAHLAAVGPIQDLLEHWHAFAVVQAWRDALAGDWVAGRQRLRAIRRNRARTPTTSFARARMDAAESLLALLAGDYAGARQLARSAAVAAPEGVTALARVELAAGRDAEATAALQRLGSAAAHSLRIEAEADALRAVLVLRGGVEADVDRIVAQLADTVRRSYLLVPFIGLTGPDRDRLVESAQALGRPEFAERLLRARPTRAAAFVAVPVLTERERAVLDALVGARSTAEIAELLYVSPNTVKTQLRSLYRKLGVSTREQAVARAIALGLAEGSPAEGRP